MESHSSLFKTHALGLLNHPSGCNNKSAIISLGDGLLFLEAGFSGTIIYAPSCIVLYNKNISSESSIIFSVTNPFPEFRIDINNNLEFLSLTRPKLPFKKCSSGEDAVL